MRRLDCSRAIACLELAESEGWPAFTCSECDGFTPPDQVQRARDLTGLILINALANDAGAYEVGDERVARTEEDE